MATNERQSSFKLGRSARNIGLSALAATAIGVYSLQQHSVSNAAVAAVATATPVISLTPTATGLYQDGQYEGDSYAARRFGNVQVEVVISGGQITDINILDYPYERSTSNRISQLSLPYLMQEAIQVQSASVDLISGATYTSEAFIESLQTALDDAAAAPAATITNGSSL